MKSCAERCVNCDAEGAAVLHPFHETLEKYREIHPYLFTNRPRLFCSADCLRQNCREWETPLLQIWSKELKRLPHNPEKQRLIHLSSKTVDHLLSRNAQLFRLFFAAAKKEFARYVLNMKIRFWSDIHTDVAVLENKQKLRMAEFVNMKQNLVGERERIARIETKMANLEGFEPEFKELEGVKQQIREVDAQITRLMRETEEFTPNEIYAQLQNPPDTLIELLTFWVDDMEFMAPNFVCEYK